MTDVPPLTKLYNDLRHQLGDKGRPLSHREAAARAQDPGKYETLRLIGTGKHSGRISEDVVRTLVALGAKERDVRRAAGHQLEVSLGPFTLPDRAQRLTGPQRDIVLTVVDGLLSAYEQGRRDAAGDGREVSDAEVLELPRAARKRRTGPVGPST